jgi:GDP-L-fucose synthase
MNKKLFIAGHKGMVGSALLRAAAAAGWTNVVTASRYELDLTMQDQVEDFMFKYRFDAVIIAAAKVGGIVANRDLPADFISDNLIIQHNLIDLAYKTKVDRLLFLGSSCIYPKEAPQPMTEDCLLTSALEPTNESYAIAKIAGLKMCQSYRRQHGVLFHSVMPTNLYGPGDNFHPEHSHVLPALIRRFHEATLRGDSDVILWGTGTPRREFLHVDDLAQACFHILKVDNPPDWINVGTGTDISILELAHLVAKTVGFKGNILTDPSKPDGTPRKLLDVSKLKELGWSYSIELEEGIQHAYDSFLQAEKDGTARLL